MDPMLEEFQAELYDKYYPQIMEGIERMEQGDVGGGIEVLSRPLHTIKGVTGFMAGFEEASRFTHKVESFLKKLQSGEVGAAEETIGAAVRAVNLVFQVIEQIKDAGGADQQETAEVLALLESLQTSKVDVGPTAQFDLRSETSHGVRVIRLGTPRIHLEAHRAPLVAELGACAEGTCVLLDLSQVISFNSASWEAVEAFAGSLSLCVCGLSPVTKETFYSWGFDKAVLAYATEQDFWASVSKEQPLS
ncbi:MAG: histidine kinase [Desulfovibrionaceae bacterium]